MKKWIVPTGAGLVAVWLVLDTVHEFIANDPIGYFTDRPADLLCVVAVAVLGGLATLLYGRLSARGRRHFRVIFWGACASSITAFVGYFGLRFAAMERFVVERRDALWIILVLVLFVAIASYLWWECVRAWRSGPSR